MSFLEHTIDINDLPVNESTGDFSPLPEGEYTVTIKQADVKDTKAGNGQYINLRLDVADGKYARRVLFAMITLKNASEKAESIGRGQLRDLMSACGIGSLQDTDQLLGHTVMVRVGQRDYNGTTQNDVKGYKSVGGGIPATSGPAIPTPATAAQYPGKANPPWIKK